MEFGTATALGAGLNLVGGLFSNVTNRLIARENLQYQREANSQNIAFQQRENEITREREDNAVQRAAADMTAAGLSKTLAAGQPASAQAMSAPQTQALHDSYKYESALQKMDMARLLQNMAVQQKELDMKDEYNKAQVGLINAQTAGVNLQNGTFMENFRNEQNLKLAQAFNFRMSAQESDARTKIYQIEGKYKARQIEISINKDISEILKNKSTFDLNYKQIDKLAYDKAESIARIFKLGKEVQMLMHDIIQAKLVNSTKRWDLQYAMKYNLPVGSLLNGTAGSILNGVRSVVDGDYSGSGLGTQQPVYVNGVHVPYGSYSSGMEMPAIYLDMVKNR